MGTLTYELLLLNIFTIVTIDAFIGEWFLWTYMSCIGMGTFIDEWLLWKLKGERLLWTVCCYGDIYR